MSKVARDWAKRQKAGSASAKIVLLVLADFADGSGLCWPSRATIAELTELSLRSVVDQLKALETRGLIARGERNREDGSQTSSLIQLNVESDKGVQDVQGGVQELHPPVQDVHGGMQEMHPGGARLAPLEPTLEPLELGTNVPVASAAPSATTPMSEEPWIKDVEFAKVWEIATPEMRRRAKSKAKVWPEWRKIRKATDPSVVLAGLVAYLSGDPDVKRTGGPGLHIWLRDRTFETWACDTPSEMGAGWTEDRWAVAVGIWRMERRWDERLGPEPGEPGCRVPANLIIVGAAARSVA